LRKNAETGPHSTDWRRGVFGAERKEGTQSVLKGGMVEKHCAWRITDEIWEEEIRSVVMTVRNLLADRYEWKVGYEVGMECLSTGVVLGGCHWTECDV